eukprot:5162167-Amphidinium_carterae.1
MLNAACHGQRRGVPSRYDGGATKSIPAGSTSGEHVSLPPSQEPSSWLWGLSKPDGVAGFEDK